MNTPFHLILFKTFSAQRNAIRPYMAEAGLSPGQPKILTYLSLHNNCIQKDLAKACDIEPATVSSLLNVMEENGLIKRLAIKENKRAFCISITDKGLEAHKKIEGFFQQIEAASLSGFSEEEINLFKTYLCRMYKNLTSQIID